MKILKDFIGIILGAIISIIIAHIYYKKSGKELEVYIKKLSKEIMNLKKISDELNHDTKLQLERYSKLEKNECAKIIEKQNGYGLETSESIEGKVKVRK